MKLNSEILDPAGLPAKLITLPIPGRQPQLAVILYPDGHGKLADLAQCRPAEPPDPPIQPRLL
jgi:hypothetical protein